MVIPFLVLPPLPVCNMFQDCVSSRARGHQQQVLPLKLLQVVSVHRSTSAAVPNLHDALFIVKCSVSYKGTKFLERSLARNSHMFVSVAWSHCFSPSLSPGAATALNSSVWPLSAHSTTSFIADLTMRHGTSKVAATTMHSKQQSDQRNDLQLCGEGQGIASFF